MTPFTLDYIPENLALADKPTWVSSTDGDTPTIQTPVRMLGMDAPELHFGGASESNPDKYDAAFASFLTTAGRELPAGLKKHLAKRLAGEACKRHIRAGEAARDHFAAIVKERLDRGLGLHGKPLQPRRLFVMASTEVFDRYGRFLCYLNAAYTREERETIPVAKRQTFNLQMMQDGHAASLLIYPNVPKPDDLVMVRKAVKAARVGKKGFWVKASSALLAYEFRWIIDTVSGRRNGPDRFCGDLETGLLHAPAAYYKVTPENRLFFYPRDVGRAVDMGFRMAAET